MLLNTFIIFQILYNNDIILQVIVDRLNSRYKNILIIIINIINSYNVSE